MLLIYTAMHINTSSSDGIHIEAVHMLHLDGDLLPSPVATGDRKLARGLEEMSPWGNLRACWEVAFHSAYPEDFS